MKVILSSLYSAGQMLLASKIRTDLCASVCGPGTPALSFSLHAKPMGVPMCEQGLGAWHVGNRAGGNGGAEITQ